MSVAHPPGASHHLVSRGYQQNVASEDKRVALVSTDTGDVIDPQRAIKSNFSIVGFNDVELPDGEHDPSLEAGSAEIERPVLDQIRRLRAGAIRKDQRKAVVKLFSMHLVRSETRGEHIARAAAPVCASCASAGATGGCRPDGGPVLARRHCSGS